MIRKRSPFQGKEQTHLKSKPTQLISLVYGSVCWYFRHNAWVLGLGCHLGVGCPLVSGDPLMRVRGRDWAHPKVDTLSSAQLPTGGCLGLAETAGDPFGQAKENLGHLPFCLFLLGSDFSSYFILCFLCYPNLKLSFSFLTCCIYELPSCNSKIVSLIQYHS